MVTDVMLDIRAVEAVKAALEEDVGAGDATTLALVDPAVKEADEWVSVVRPVVAL